MGKLISGLKGSAGRFASNLSSSFSSAWNKHGPVLGDYLDDYKKTKGEKSKEQLKNVVFGDTGIAGIAKTVGKSVDLSVLAKANPMKNFNLKSPEQLDKLMNGENMDISGLLKKTGINMGMSSNGFSISKILDMAKKKEIDPKDLGMDPESMMPKVNSAQFDVSKYENMDINSVDPDQIMQSFNTDMQVPNFGTTNVGMIDMNALEKPPKIETPQLNLTPKMGEISIESPGDIDFTKMTSSFSMPGVENLEGTAPKLSFETPKMDITEQVKGKLDLTNPENLGEIGGALKSFNTDSMINDIGLDDFDVSSMASADNMTTGFDMLKNGGFTGKGGMLDLKGAISDVDFGNDFLNGLLKAIFIGKDKVMSQKGISQMRKPSDYLTDNGNLKSMSGFKADPGTTLKDMDNELNDFYGFGDLMQGFLGTNEASNFKANIDFKEYETSHLADFESQVSGMPSYSGELDLTELNSAKTKEEFDEIMKKIRGSK